MTRLDLKSIAAALAATHSITVDDAEKFLGVMFEVVVDGLRHDGQVKVKGLGTFKLIGVPEREMVDVNSGERITVEARSRISFSPDAVLRDIINKPFVFFDTVVLNDGVSFDDEQDADDNDDEEEQDAEDMHRNDEDTDDTAAEPEEEQQSCSTVDTPVEQTAEEIKAEEPAVEEPSTEEPAEEEPAAEQPTVDEPVAEEPVEAEEPAEEKDRQNAAPQAVNKALDNARSIMDDIEKGNLETDDEDEEEERSFFSRNMLTILIVLMLIVGAGAFIYGTSGISLGLFGDDDEETEVVADTTAVKSVVKDTLATDTVARDSIMADSIVAADTIKADTAVAEKVKPEASEYDRYDEMDVRVRTGAYRIVGVDRVVKVRAGQTLKSITRANLGEGMECYVEVLNGVKSVQPGDSLKIPKLKWRKKRK